MAAGNSVGISCETGTTSHAPHPHSGPSAVSCKRSFEIWGCSAWRDHRKEFSKARCDTPTFPEPMRTDQCLTGCASSNRSLTLSGLCSGSEVSRCVLWWPAFTTTHERGHRGLWTLSLLGYSCQPKPENVDKKSATLEFGSPGFLHMAVIVLCLVDAWMQV